MTPASYPTVNRGGGGRDIAVIASVQGWHVWLGAHRSLRRSRAAVGCDAAVGPAALGTGAAVVVECRASLVSGC